MICSQLRALGGNCPRYTSHYCRAAPLKQAEANSDVPQTGTLKCLWMSGTSRALNYQSIEFHPVNIKPTEKLMNICISSTKLNETLKLQTKLLLRMKSSQPHQDSSSS